jgi:hypothetical protein
MIHFISVVVTQEKQLNFLKKNKKYKISFFSTCFLFIFLHLKMPKDNNGQMAAVQVGNE